MLLRGSGTYRELCHSTKHRSLLFVLAIAFAVAAGTPGANAGENKEYALKAAFLYQFTKYVTWPEGDGPVQICVLGQDPFGSTLDETLAGKTAKGQPVTVKRLSQVAATGDCRILFLSRSEMPAVDATLQALRNRATLTVADSPGFPSRGGMINLNVENDRIKLEINPDNAARAGLKIRSELLRLAKVVRN